MTAEERAVAVARETHWSLPETLRLLAEIRSYSQATVQAIGVDLAIARDQGRLPPHLAALLETTT